MNRCPRGTPCLSTIRAGAPVLIQIICRVSTNPEDRSAPSHPLSSSLDLRRNMTLVVLSTSPQKSPTQPKSQNPRDDASCLPTQIPQPGIRDWTGQSRHPIRPGKFPTTNGNARGMSGRNEIRTNRVPHRRVAVGIGCSPKPRLLPLGG
jgi:hypothetical protein